MANYRVGVIFGGRNTEHEVSVVTGVQMMQYISKRHTVVPIYITREGAWLTGAKLCSLQAFKNLSPKDPELSTLVVTPDRGVGAIQNPLPKGLLDKPKKVELDVIFPTLHGMNGEDGTLQGLLELADLPYVGAGVMASAICMDKAMTKVALRGNGLPILDFLSFTRAEWEREEEALVAKIEAKFGYPVIVKPARLGSSIGIEVAKTPDDLRFHISVATHFDQKIVIEPYLKDRVDINCSVMGNDELAASVCEQPVSHEALLTFADKYLAGQQSQGMEGAKRIVPAPISTEMTAEVQRLAKEAFRAVDGRGIARVDFLLDRTSNKLYVNELNTLPGSFATYLWEPVGIPAEELADRLVTLAIEAHREKAKTQFTSGNQLLQHADFLGLKKA